MTSGHFYKHELASDIFIDVLKIYPIKPGVSLVKCRVFSALYNVYYETTKFRLNDVDKHFWKVYNLR